MSMYGSTSRLHTMGQRSNSRPDLSSASFRNDGFIGGGGGGGGFPMEFQDGGGGGASYSYTTFSRHSTHGGGYGGGHKGQMSMGGGGGLRYEPFQVTC